MEIIRLLLIIQLLIILLLYNITNNTPNITQNITLNSFGDENITYIVERKDFHLINV